MTTLTPMYSPQANSPQTTTVGALTEGSTQVVVLDASILPSAPTLLVLGGETNAAETVLCTDVNENTLTIQRAVEGAASAWAAGTTIGRLFCAADLAAVQENITKLNQGKAETLALNSHINNTGNPHEVTAEQVGALVQSDLTAALADYLLLAGGTMTGAIAMGGNKITGLANGTATQDAVNLGQLNSAIGGLGAVFVIKGSVDYYSDLPTSGNTVGDVYYVINSETIQDVLYPGQVGYIWITIDGVTQWEQLGQTIDVGSLQVLITASGILKGNGSGSISAATAGTDYVDPSALGAASGVATLDGNSKVTPAQASARIITISSSTSLSAAHAGCLVGSTATGAITVTISSGLAEGTEIEVMNYGGGAVTVSPASGVTLNGGSNSFTISNQYTSGVLKCVASNTWVIQGAIE